MDLPIGSETVDQVITSNPYIPEELSVDRNIMAWLPEAARVLKTGGELVINGHKSNPFTQLPDQEILNNLNLEVVVKNEPLLEKFQQQEFYNTQGEPLIKEKMKSSILRKVEGPK